MSGKSEWRIRAAAESSLDQARACASAVPKMTAGPLILLRTPAPGRICPTEIKAGTNSNRQEPARKKRICGFPEQLLREISVDYRIM